MVTCRAATSTIGTISTTNGTSCSREGPVDRCGNGDDQVITGGSVDDID